MRAIGDILGAPDAGFYAGLNREPASAPAKKLRTPEEIRTGRKLRGLSEKQKQAYSFLPAAVERIAEEVKERKQRWLRRLDTIHHSGCRTKQQVWSAVGDLSEPMFARLDIATLCLGWLEKDGTFRLNRQRGLAEDSGLTDCRVSRTLTSLEKAGYIRRKIRRIYKQGKCWVTRVTIHLRPRFFIDLGLGHALAQARISSKKRRERQLKEAAQAQQTAALHELTSRQRKAESHKRAMGAKRLKDEQKTHELAIEREKRRIDLMGQLMELHPDLPHEAIFEAVNKKYPPAR